MAAAGGRRWRAGAAVSPLALPVLAVPVVAELLEGRYQEAWRDMAALGLADGLWLVLPVWVAGQELGAGQAGWLLGRPPGRGSVAASLADDRLTWLLVAAGLAAAILTWRHRSGARPDDGPAPGGPPGRPGRSPGRDHGGRGPWGRSPSGTRPPRPSPSPCPPRPSAWRWPAAAARRPVGRGTAGVPPVGRGRGRGGAGRAARGPGGRLGGEVRRPADDGLGRLVATVGDQVPDCSAVNASGPDDRARLLAAGVTVTDFADGPAAHAAGVRYFVLTGGTGRGGP